MTRYPVARRFVTLLESGTAATGHDFVGLHRRLREDAARRIAWPR